jgi:cytochrome c biogenesis protein CcmG/thiol:disulfide interchange protein DsbE
MKNPGQSHVPRQTQLILDLTSARVQVRARSGGNPTHATRTGLLGTFIAWTCCLIAPAHASAPLDLDALRGRVVYLDFWASWCAPCRQSFPWMQAMKNTYERQGLTVITVNLDHDRADAERFLRRFHPDFAVQFDPQGTLAEHFKVTGMPTSVIIDRHGIARFTHIGFRPADREAYTMQVQELLAEK